MKRNTKHRRLTQARLDHCATSCNDRSAASIARGAYHCHDQLRLIRSSHLSIFNHIISARLSGIQNSPARLSKRQSDYRKHKSERWESQSYRREPHQNQWERQSNCREPHQNQSEHQSDCREHRPNQRERQSSQLEHRSLPRGNMREMLKSCMLKRN